MSQYFENNIFNAEDFSLSSQDSAEFVGCHFIGIDMSTLNFSRLKFLDCEFVECNLSNSSLKGGNFRGATFKKSKLIGLNWTEAGAVASCSFADCLLDYSVFHSMNLKGFSFTDCKMMEVEFSEAQLVKSTITGCMLRGASFNKAYAVQPSILLMLGILTLKRPNSVCLKHLLFCLHWTLFSSKHDDYIRPLGRRISSEKFCLNFSIEHNIHYAFTSFKILQNSHNLIFFGLLFLW
jgi:uncharacterized protein YjbI with pentapeptide repeats